MEDAVGAAVGCGADAIVPDVLGATGVVEASLLVAAAVAVIGSCCD